MSSFVSIEHLINEHLGQNIIKDEVWSKKNRHGAGFFCKTKIDYFTRALNSAPGRNFGALEAGILIALPV